MILNWQQINLVHLFLLRHRIHNCCVSGSPLPKRSLKGILKRCLQQLQGLCLLEVRFHFLLLVLKPWLCSAGVLTAWVIGKTDRFKAAVVAKPVINWISIPQTDELMSTPWSVYSRACLSNTETVIKYLSRYTQKGMLRETRLRCVEEQNVTFRLV
jgi:hypothetical protein